MSLRMMNHHNPMTHNVSAYVRQSYGTLNVRCHIYRLLRVRIPVDDNHWDSLVPQATREETVSMEIPTFDLLMGSFDTLPCLVCNSSVLSEQRIPEAFHLLITRDYYTMAALIARRWLSLPNSEDRNSRTLISWGLVNTDTRVVSYEGFEEIIRRAVEETTTSNEMFPPATRSPIEVVEKVSFCGSEDEKCSICLEELEVGLEVGRLPCFHVYHEDCIAQWLERSRTCPPCLFPCRRNAIKNES